MCGIFAYLNFCVPCQRQNVYEILLRGLERLEYRGYDSAGQWQVVLLNQANLYQFTVRFTNGLTERTVLVRHYVSNIQNHKNSALQYLTWLIAGIAVDYPEEGVHIVRKQGKVKMLRGIVFGMFNNYKI